MSLTYIQIGSWNIKHLGRQPTAQQQAQSVYALTDHIEMAGIDVLALQEIYITEADGMRNAHIERACVLLKEHTGSNWNYKLLENRNPQDTSQLCGFLWNESILELQGTLPIPVKTKIGEDWLWDRKPHAVKFETREKLNGEKKSFIAVNLHMKSNYRDRRAKYKRTLEAEELCRHLPWVIDQLGDESLVLLGDTNILGGWEKAIDHFADAGLDDLNAEDAATFAGGTAPFDRIFVSSHRDEFKYSRQYVLRSANESAHLDYLSDHYLIKTSLKAYVDED